MAKHAYRSDVCGKFLNVGTHDLIRSGYPITTLDMSVAIYPLSEVQDLKLNVRVFNPHS